jgi:hypothetical protein
MAQPAIIDKLRPLLKNSVDSEPLVVYILVEIRKIIDIENDGGYPTLRHYCNWAVHHKLDQKSAIEIIKLFDDIEEAIATSNKEEETRLTSEASQLLSIEKFRKELSSFLGSHGLVTTLCKDDDKWRIFVASYLAVIDDVPATYNHTPIKHVKNVTVSLIRDQVKHPFLEKIVYGGKQQIHFELKWTPELFSGQKGRSQTIHFTSPSK